ncbi:esterase/lipase family protein [Priestia megaterium]|uniref:esterase/lipase family protein n=1 Tax=Priestia megaterium TaxID=1404 RepID=UPI0015E3B1DA|nr:alpha/beta fold hydrolase [Priestia megaterium]
MDENKNLYDLSIVLDNYNNGKNGDPSKVETQELEDKTINMWNNFKVNKSYVIKFDISDNSSRWFRLHLDVICRNYEFAFMVEEGYLEDFNSLSNENFHQKGLLTEFKEFNKEGFSILSLDNLITKLSKKTRRTGELILNLFIGEFIDTNKKVVTTTKGKLQHLTVNEEGSISLKELPVKQLNPEKKIAIFVHGLASEVGRNFIGLYTHLNTKYNIYAFSYPTITTGIDENGKVLKECIEELLQTQPQTHVNIFAHSMGGLVSRSALRQNAPIKNIVMAGTPNNGADLAKFLLDIFVYSIRGLLVGIIPKELRKAIRRVNHSDAVGLKDLSYRSEFIVTLNKNDYNNRANLKKYFAIAGNKYRFSDKVVKVRNVGSIRDIDSNDELQLYGFIQKWEHGEYYLENDQKLINALDVARNYIDI